MGEGGRDYGYRIKRLSVYPQKGAEAVTAGEMTFLEGKGIQGDFHADGGERQISLLTEEKKNWMKAQEIQGFCFRKYKENILLEEVSGSKKRDPQPGDLLEAGEAVLELTESLKICHPELCELSKAGKTCLLAGGHSFAKVKKGGTVTVGTAVQVKEKDNSEYIKGWVPKKNASLYVLWYTVRNNRKIRNLLTITDRKGENYGIIESCIRFCRRNAG